MEDAGSNTQPHMRASREGDRIMSKRALTLCFVIFFAHATVTAAQELKKVRIGYPSLGFRQGHIWVAKDQGLFRKYGLDVEPIFLRGGQLAIQALAAGDPLVEHRSGRTSELIGFRPCAGCGSGTFL